MADFPGSGNDQLGLDVGVIASTWGLGWVQGSWEGGEGARGLGEGGGE